jgi:hypothetical protein
MKPIVISSVYRKPNVNILMPITFKNFHHHLLTILILFLHMVPQEEPLLSGKALNLVATWFFKTIMQ